LIWKIAIFIAWVSVSVFWFLFGAPAAQEQATASAETLPGLQRPVTVTRDRWGVPHVTASGDQDVYFMMGYLHAQDRFFQMDFERRLGAGTLAELLGAGPDDQTLESDIQFRTFGVVRSAERSLGAYTPEVVALIQSYSDGVNAWLDRNPLPPEYPLLEITRVPKWRPLDSIIIAKLIQFQLSFDPVDLGNTETLLNYQAAGEARGFDGMRLFFEDLFRSAPFDTAVTVPQPVPSALPLSPKTRFSNIQLSEMAPTGQLQVRIGPEVMRAARRLMGRSRQNPFQNRAELGVGSNWWVVAGSKTATGNAMLANDPHLGLGLPATFYEIHLMVESPSSPMNVSGVSFSGIPGVFLGQNERISWGATTSALDLTDFYAERLASENGIPVGTLYRNQVEPLVTIPETFRTNQAQNGIVDDVVAIAPGDRPTGLTVPPVTLIVPRRNNGPLIPGGPADGLSMQYVGASATRDLEGILALARARDLTDFKRGLQLLEAGSLNWAYADVEGNIATFVNGKVPLREDLQAGTVEGLPPFFIRDGTGAVRNEWIPRSDQGPGFNYESLPFEEMPQTVNPAQGFLVNANNDPLGVTLDNNPINQIRSEGLYYISGGFNPGFRAAKITALLNQQLDRRRGQGKISFQDLQCIQSNVQLFDAEVFVPYIIRAFGAARRTGAPAELAALAGDPAVREAVERLSSWDFSSPTGIPEGYDGEDRNGLNQRPSNREVAHSVAATIYTVWRSQMLARTIIATLRRVGLEEFQPGNGGLLVGLRFLLDNFAAGQGRGASGLDFFEIPGVEAPPRIRRDLVILESLKAALNRLAGDDFAAVFGGSTNQQDYRWGKLHRITFSHLFGGLVPQFSIPPAGDFADLSPSLPGLATDGGWESIDIGSFDIRAASLDAYTFSYGANRRYVGELGRDGIRAVQILPGGQSGVAGNRFYANQLSSWLTNDYHPVLSTKGEIHNERHSRIVYRPAN
jgi:penicillin G amidase